MRRLAMLTNQSCGLCGGSIVPWLHMPIDAKKNQRTPFSSVLKCRHCGLGTLSPLPEPHEIADLYKLDSYYTHGKSHMPERQPSLADRVLTKLAWWADGSRSFEPADVAVQLPKGAKICDLGCGDAQYLRQFDSLGFDVTGVDPDLSARKQAAAAEIRVLEGTAEALPSELVGKRFDLIIILTRSNTAASRSLRCKMRSASLVRELCATLKCQTALANTSERSRSARKCLILRDTSIFSIPRTFNVWQKRPDLG